MAFHLARCCLMAVLALLIIFSVAMIALKVTNHNFIDENTGSSFDFYPDNKHNNWLMSALPLNLYTSAPKLVLASGAISIITALGVLIFSVLAWPDGKRTYLLPPCRLLPAVLSLNGFFSTFTLAYNLTVHARSAHFHPYNKSNWTQELMSHHYSAGAFDLEGWTCQVAEALVGNNEQHDYAEQCRDERNGRVLLIVQGVLSIVAAVVAVLVFKQAEAAVREGIEMKKKRNQQWDGDELEIS